jgi:methylaspartate mutase sigma subunit
MGVIDCEGLRDRCDAAGLKNIVLYAGGTVVAPRELESNWDEVERRFAEMGFNKVFPNTVALEDVGRALKVDLGIND